MALLSCSAFWLISLKAHSWKRPLNKHVYTQTHTRIDTQTQNAGPSGSRPQTLSLPWSCLRILVQPSHRHLDVGALKASAVLRRLKLSLPAPTWVHGGHLQQPALDVQSLQQLGLDPLPCLPVASCRHLDKQVSASWSSSIAWPLSVPKTLWSLQ